jgi:uncharacterized repeat protein (TIGR03803 family)
MLRREEVSPRLGFWTIGAAVVLLLLTTSAWASSEKVLLNFHGTDGSDGNSLIFDPAGNLYGIAVAGGAGTCSGGCGTIFKLTSTSSGWVTSVIHDFRGGSDGMSPSGGLIFDPQGNLYGVTTFGGGGGGCNFGCGTVFKLTPGAGGQWTEKIIYRFTVSAGAGNYPNGPLIMDAAGNLYGTTGNGGACKFCGAVFELTPTATGQWSLTTLHNFTGSPDGCQSLAGLTFDAAGNLYGTTQGGNGPCNFSSGGGGTVFELSPVAGGGWTETTLYHFLGGADGDTPNSGVVFDAAGNLYGTTQLGGTTNFGTVFKLSPVSGGGWSKTTIYAFNFNPDGTNPVLSTPVLDAAGNLYGTTIQGGTGIGTVFKLTPGSGTTWTETQLHVFGVGHSNDGRNPVSTLIFDAAGNLYGTTISGGTNGFGTVFEITP